MHLNTCHQNMFFDPYISICRVEGCDPPENDATWKKEKENEINKKWNKNIFPWKFRNIFYGKHKNCPIDGRQNIEELSTKNRTLDDHSSHMIVMSILGTDTPLPDHISGTGDGLIDRKNPRYKRIYCSGAGAQQYGERECTQPARGRREPRTIFRTSRGFVIYHADL